jgi:hypothetical protein
VQIRFENIRHNDILPPTSSCITLKCTFCFQFWTTICATLSLSSMQATDCIRGTKSRILSITKIILNEMKICCFNNSKFCTFGMDGWQTIIKKKSILSQLPSVAGTFQFRNECSFPFTTRNFSTRRVNVSFSTVLLRREFIYSLFLNCNHSTYSAKMIITLQSTGVPHVTW